MRQLLMAAVPTAVDEVKSRGNGDREVTVATPVEGATVVLTIAKSGDNGATVRVEAELRGKKGAETLDLQKAGDGGWRVAETRLLYVP